MSGGYRWDAADYARNSAAQQSWALELIDKLSLAGAETVLDSGCGDGKVTAEIARRVPRGSVTGVDSSPDMVAAARRAWPREVQANLDFQIADARALPFESTFDVAFSNATLHWVVDHRPVLRGVARALRPGGRLLFQFGGRGNGAAIFAVAEEMTGSAAWRRFFEGFVFPWGFYGPEEYASWCREAGLEPRRVELLPRAMHQQGRAGLASWIRTTWLPYTERVPAERREEFVTLATELYLARRPLDAEGRAVVDMVRLEVDAARP